jgi:SAM-dependent methyltransferase
VLRGVAEALPLPADAVDVALVVLSLHHWTDWRAGLAELRRVSRRQVIVTFDPDLVRDFWLIQEYLPEALDLPFNHPPTSDEVAAALGGASVAPLLVPHDLVDGVLCASWRRPERYLDPAVLAAASSTAALSPEVVRRGIARLADDLASGEWHARHADLLDQEQIDGGFRLVVT